MGEYTLIPFGLRNKNQELVDVSEVARGIKCDCICPSCSTPLIARQGEIKEWHFAHASKGVSESTKQECEYSFWVSVILMAKQVLGTSRVLALPSLTMYLEDRTEIKVAERRSVQVNDVELEKSLAGINADAAVTIGDYVILVVFTAPHKSVPEYVPHEEHADTTGVLAISLDKAYTWLFGRNLKGQYSRVIREKVVNEYDDKKWLYHPRIASIEKQLKALLYASYPYTQETEIASPEGSIYESNFKCLLCAKEWYGSHVCSHCQTHLYSSEIKSD